MRYTVTALVGSEFYHGPQIHLGKHRFFFTAWLRAKVHLYFHPAREVIITRP